MTPAALRSLFARFAAAEPLDVALWREAAEELSSNWEKDADQIYSAEFYEDPNLLFPVAMSWLPEGAIWRLLSLSVGVPPHYGCVIGDHHTTAKSAPNALAAAICAAKAELAEGIAP